MTITQNVPQSSAPVPTPSLAQIFLSEIHTQRNLYSLLLSNCSSIRVENFSTAPLILQLFPVGSASPFVFTINPGGVEQLTGKVPYDRCLISNLTDFPLPYGGIGQSGGAIVTGYVQIAGLDSDMTIQAGSPVPPSAANPTSVTILGTVPVSGAVTVPSGVAVTNSPNVGVPGGVAVTNSPNVGVPGGVAVTNTPNVGVPGGVAVNGDVPVLPVGGQPLPIAARPPIIAATINYTAPVVGVLAATITVDPSWSALAFFCTGSPTIVSVRGNVTTHEYLHATDFNLDVVRSFSLLQAHDTALQVFVTDPGSGPFTIYASAIRDTVASPAGGVPIQGNVGIPNDVGVINGTSGSLDTHGGSVYMSYVLYTAPKTFSFAGTMTVGSQYQGLMIYGELIPNGVRLQIRGTITGIIYFDALINPLVPVMVAPIHARDTGVDVWVDTHGLGLGNNFINFSGIKVPIASVPLNFGNAPLIVQPASGSSQTVVPGTAAVGSVASIGNSFLLGSANIGGAITRPTNLYGIATSAAYFVGAVGATAAANATVLIGLKGTTSLKTIYLSALSIHMDSQPAGGNISGTAWDSQVFPYPIPLSTIFPSDANLQPLFLSDAPTANINCILNMLTS